MTDRDGRMDAVRGDMDALLGRSALCRAPLPGEDLPDPRPAAPAAARGGRGRGVGLGVLLLLGVGTGIAMGGWPAQPVVADGVRQSVGGKAPAPSRAPTVAAAQPVEVPTLDLAAIEAARAPDPEVADPVEQQVAVRAEPVAPAPARTRAAPRREVAARRDDCGRYEGADAAACLYDRLLDADGRLAAAYERAVDAGVPVADLRMLRREWSRARRYAEDDPIGVAEAFDAIAADLRAASRAYSRRAVL
ncbi:hypothetical protein GGR88_000427 [Sphingomonas jejuensis]|uniref:Lysozyme inhibitor LprI N-terminal domain-containing protein n=1 Tax=Sphingomonas jejuensis TaxID=904715 RepID=A0ABX0XHZ4_9SPHN|nr:hypothetical protein [Sphingomonas jejuensis]NJC32953.1 hypothetical protein [Sphingomonas jejuensis]